jgi:hypothetical protein
MNYETILVTLLGVVIGGMISIVGIIISNNAAHKRETLSFKRTTSQLHYDSVRSAYEFSLNVIYNMKRDGNPDRATRGDVYARLTLLGSKEVTDLITEDVLMSNEKLKIVDTNKLVKAMKKHLDSIDNTTA